MSFKASEKFKRQTDNSQTGSRAAAGNISISKAAKFLSVSPDTLRNWEAQGKLVPQRTEGGARRYSLEQLTAHKQFLNPLPKTPAAVISVSTAAKELGVSPDTIRNWDKKGIINSERTKGGSRRFSRTELKRLQSELNIKSNTNASKPSPVIFTAPALPIPVVTLKNDQSVLNPVTTYDSLPEDFNNQPAKSVFADDLIQKTNNFKNTSPNWFTAGLLGILFFAVLGTMLSLSLMSRSNQNISKAFEGTPLSFLFNNQKQVSLAKLNKPLPASIEALRQGEVLADATPSGSFLQVNLDTQINGSLFANTASISGKLSSATINTGFGDNEVYPMNQPLLTTSNVTFGGLSLGTLSLSAPSNQLRLGNTIISTQPGGSGAFTASIPTLNANGNFVIDNVSQTLTNKTISGSDNTFSNIPTSALSSNSVTINTGSGLSGGGSVSLGGSITISADGGSSGSVTSISGTANQIITSASTGDVTLSLPQDIATVSTPTFSSISLSGLNSNGVVYTTGSNTLASVSTGLTGECLLSNGAAAPAWGSCFSGSTSFTVAGDSGPNQSIGSGDTLTINGDANIATAGVNTDNFSVTLSNALTGINSIDTIAVTATALTFAGTGTLGATSTALNLQADGAIDVNIAGGSAATGCTVANTTGNLTCTGNITGGSTGTIGYWTRSGTTLSPATSGDNVTTSGNISTTGSGTGTFAGTLTASNGFTQTTGALNLTSTSGAISSTGLTSATLSVTSGTLALATATSGNITLTTGAAAGLVNVLTGNLKVGNGTPGVSLDGEDGYIEGTLEVDGTSEFDGRVGIGSAAPTTEMLKVSETKTDTSGFDSTAIITDTANPSSSSSMSFLGTWSKAQTGSSNGQTFTGDLTGVFGEAIHQGTSTLANALAFSGNPKNTSTGTITTAISFSATGQMTAAGTIGTRYGVKVANFDNSGGGTLTTNYGIRVDPQTAGTSDYGIAIGASDTQTLHLSYNADNTTAAAGIAFGSSRDTNLYRSAADTLKTDDAFNVNGTFNVSSAGVISGATGLSSSGTINFSTLTASSAVYTDGSKNLTSTAPTSGAIGYWSRSGTTLSPTTSGDAVTTSGNISTTSSGTITSAGLLTASAGLTIAANQNFNMSSGTGAFTTSFVGTGSDIHNISINGTATTGSQEPMNVNVTNTTAGATSFIGTDFSYQNASTTSHSDSAVRILAENNASGSDTINRLLYLVNADADQTVTSGIELVASTNGSMSHAINASDAEIDNAFYAGANWMRFDGTRIFEGSTGTLTFEDTSGNDLCTITDAGTTGNLACTGNITGPTTGTIGYWARSGTTLSPATSGDNVTTSGNISTTGSGTGTFAGTLTANGIFDANGQFDLGDGGDAGTISATTLDIDATGALQINSSGGAISIGNYAVAQAVNIGTGAAARTITIGNTSSTTALVFNSGTGSQTFTSSVATGTTTGSAFVFNASTLTSGTALRVTSTSTSGKLVDLNATNTSGTIFNMAYGASTVLSGDLTGMLVDLNSGNVTATNQNLTAANFKIPTVTDTHTSGTKSLTGINVNFGAGAGINQNGAGGTLEYVAGDFYLPALTQTAGTLNAFGTRVTTPATITTGGNAYGNYVSATGVGAGTLSGVGISSITGGSGTEYALNIGTGWDAVLRVGSTTVINGSGVTTAVGGGTGQSSYAVGDILYADTTTTLTKRNIGNPNEVLAVVGGVPTWTTISGSSCTNCLINNPTADQSISPTGQATTGLTVRQTSTASPTDDIFQVTDSTGAIKYFWVDKDGNVSNAGTSSQTLTLTPLTDTTALTLVGTNVTTQPLQYINSKNQEGQIIRLNYGAAQTLSTSNPLTAFNIDLSTNVTATNASVMGTHITLPGATNTHTSGTKTLTGFSVDGGSLNQNGIGGTTLYTAFDATIPAITQTAGTMTAYGININTPSSITTGGTASAFNVTATGVGAGNLYGINISNITPGAGTETGLQIGSGWDTNLLFNDTSSRIALADGGTLAIVDTSGNSLCTITDAGSTGNLDCTGSIGGTGTVGFWTRNVPSSYIIPATTSDNLRIGNGTPTVTQDGEDTYLEGFLEVDGQAIFGNNVGIGTTSPGDTLYVLENGINTSTPTTVATFFSTTSGTPAAGYGSRIQFTAETDNSSTETVMAGVGGVWESAVTGAANGGLGLYTVASSGSLTERLRVTSGGNVGIGTTAPTSLLNLASTSSSTPRGITNDQYSADGTGAFIAIRKSRSGTVGTQTIVQSADAIGSLTGYGSDGTAFIAGAQIRMAIDGTPGTNDMPGRIEFSTTLDGASAVTERMRIDNAGNVGIGTTAPSQLLQLNASGSTSFVVTSGGNVGIGTTAPAARFTIGNNVGTSFLDTFGEYQILLYDSTVAASSYGFGINTNTMVFNSGGGAYRFDRAGTATTMTLDTAGNVGIGTTNPTAQLDVNSTFTTQTVNRVLANSLTSGVAMNIVSSSSALTSGNLFASSYIGTAGFTSALNYFEYAPSSTPSTAPTGDILRLSAGINTSNFAGNFFNIKDGSSSTFSVSKTAFTTSLPSNFTASGDVSVAYDINFTNPTASYIKSAAPLTIAAGETFNSSNLTLQAYNSGQVVLDTGTSGSVYIPNSQLYQNGSAAADGYLHTNYSRLASTTALNPGILLFNGATGGTSPFAYGMDLGYNGGIFRTRIFAGTNQDVAFGHISGSNFDAQNDFTELMTIKGASGNVGIGTTTPTQKFDVVHDTVAGAYIGRAAIGDWNSFGGTADALMLSHYDQASTTGFAVVQNSGGQTTINAASGQSIRLTVANGNLVASATTVGICYNTSTQVITTSTSSCITSSARFKHDITSLGEESGLSEIMKLRPVQFVYNEDDTNTPHVGLIAEEVVAVDPRLGVYNDGRLDSVHYELLTAVLTKAVQELNYKVENALLTLDPEGVASGNLNVNKITVAQDVVVGGLVSANNFALNADLINKSGSLASVPVTGNKVSVADAVNALNSQVNQTANLLNTVQSQQASQSAELAQARILGEQAVNHAQTLDDKVASTSANLTSLSSRIDDLLASISGDNNDGGEATDSGDINDDLTPPDMLIATDSATFTNLDVTETLSTLDTKISGTLKSLGDTFLGNTTIAGDLSIDGTLSFTGNGINALPTLYFQNSPLAQAVDFFNGLVTIDKDGTFKAQTVIASEYKTITGTVSGSGKILTGQTSVDINNSYVKQNSRIMITPNTPINSPIAVTTKLTGQKFTVSINSPTNKDIPFDWFLVNETGQ